MVQIEVNRWVAEGMLAYAKDSLLDLRCACSQREGYLCGSLLQRRDDPHYCTAVSVWRSVDDWQAWVTSEDRQRLNAKIAPVLQEPEHVLVLEPMKGSTP